MESRPQRDQRFHAARRASPTGVSSKPRHELIEISISRYASRGSMAGIAIPAVSSMHPRADSAEEGSSPAVCASVYGDAALRS